MATARKTTTTTPTTTRALFREPDRAHALAYTPDGTRERWLMREALVPTLRLHAAALMGRRGGPSADEALYTHPGALRAFLTRDLTRERVGHPITPAMIAHVWWRVLRGDERAALIRYAETGMANDAAHYSAHVQRNDQRNDAQASLF